MKLSSTLKLRNFDIGMKMMAVAPHRWFVQSLVASYITFGVGYCFIHSKGNAKTRVWDKADIVPTPYFYLMPNKGDSEAIGDKNIKKLFVATLLSLLNILPIFAAPHNDEDYGDGILGGILIYGTMLIIVIIGILRKPRK